MTQIKRIYTDEILTLSLHRSLKISFALGLFADYCKLPLPTDNGADRYWREALKANPRAVGV